MIEKQLEQWIRLAQNATRESVDEIMKTLDSKASLKTTREIDYALSQVETEDGIDAIKYYLFHGTLIQRNYSALYFGRIHEYFILKEAYEMGLIDEIQAFSR